MSNTETSPFMAGFRLAHPPGSDEADALDRAERIFQSCPGFSRVAIPLEIVRTFLAFSDGLPGDQVKAARAGFLRGAVARAGIWPVSVDDIGRA